MLNRDCPSGYHKKHMGKVMGAGFAPNVPYGPTAVSPAGMGPGPYGPTAVSPAGMGPGPYGPTAVSPAGMGPGPYGPAGMGPGPYGPAGVGPAGVGPAPFGPAGVGPAGVGPAPFAPTNVLPTAVAPPQVTPPQEFVNTNVMNTVVPHVHPSHTTTVNKHLFTHKHYFPHSQSVVNQCLSQHLVCPGPPPFVSPIHPCPPRPFC